MKFVVVLLILVMLGSTVNGTPASRYGSQMVQQNRISTRSGAGLSQALGNSNVMYKLLTDALKRVNPDIQLEPAQRVVYTKNPPENEEKRDQPVEPPPEDVPDHPPTTEDVPMSRSASPTSRKDAVADPQAPEMKSTIYEAIIIPRHVDKAVYDNLRKNLGSAPGLECSPTDPDLVSVQRAAHDSHEGGGEDSHQEHNDDHSHEDEHSDDHSREPNGRNHDESEDLTDFSEGTKQLELIVNEKELSEEIIRLLKELSVHPPRVVKDEYK